MSQTLASTYLIVGARSSRSAARVIEMPKVSDEQGTKTKVPVISDVRPLPADHGQLVKLINRLPIETGEFGHRVDHAPMRRALRL